MGRIDVIATRFSLDRARQWTHAPTGTPEILYGYTVTTTPGFLGRLFGARPRRSWVFVHSQGDLRYVETGCSAPITWLDAIQRRALENVALEDRMIAEARVEIEHLLTEGVP